MYPNGEDYIRAVQEPQRVFRLPALRGAAFELHPVFGIPMPASGNAAVVFRASVDGTDTALRFFIREDASSQDRYTALGRHFVDRGIADCVATAAWVDDAISVNRSSWPMVQMSWVDGRTLDTYVGHLVATGNTAALSHLADTWRSFIGRLQAAEYAHGDLQHGNVLIDTSGALRLVDFDGSWIAAVRGGPPPKETGHPNYQHTGRQWGQWMDTFPALVIYTALLALSRRPTFWADLHSGENILFSAEDFAPPFRTRTWELLSAIGDAHVEHAAELLKLACDPEWSASGTLESLLATELSVPAPARREAAATPTFPGIGAPGTATPWWQLTAAPAGDPGLSAAGASPAAPAPPPSGPLPPPPPMKTAPGAAAPDRQSFARPARAGAWYQYSGSGPARSPVGPSTHNGAPVVQPTTPRRSAATTTLLALVAAILAGLLGAVAGVTAGAVAAIVTALIVVLVAVRLLRQKR